MGFKSEHSRRYELKGQSSGTKSTMSRRSPSFRACSSAGSSDQMQRACLDFALYPFCYPFYVLWLKAASNTRIFLAGNGLPAESSAHERTSEWHRPSVHYHRICEFCSLFKEASVQSNSRTWLKKVGSANYLYCKQLLTSTDDSKE